MRQRSCSHRVSELYNEIILTAKFQEKFGNKDSFYFENIYCSVFWGKDFQIKLLILDKETQNIIFENVSDNTYIFYNNIKTDSFLYSFDLSNSTIRKFNNPILNNGLVHNSIQEQHSFISLSKSINDIVIKDEVIYFSITIISLSNENRHSSIEINNVTSLDSLAANLNFWDSEILLGLCVFTLTEIGRNCFLIYSEEEKRGVGVERLSITHKKLSRKNSIIISCMDSYYMEPISHFIDYKIDFVKQLHPEYAIEINETYVLIIPFYAYNTFSDFKLIRLTDLNEVDLFEIPMIKEINNDINFFIDNTDFNGNNILLVGNYEFSCENLFSVKQKKPLEINKSSNLKSLIPIKGNYFDGYALEIHTIKSTLKKDGSFETLRTDLGEMLYQLKYNFDKSVIDKIAVKCADTINNLFADIDAIIPSPPSNLNRPFQPVYELAKRISELTDIKLDINYVSKLPTEQIKSLTESDDRNLVLERAISIKDDRYRNKNILLFDDLFRSGDTLNIIAKKLKNEGGINSIKALCVTKTRTKR
jgi:competence protein ComFC